ncbi:Gfo/Idh/MocA family protein [Devosia beringensis]|uniref:Gfo/Idh/MocA family protein n=1 Tax=Devosia beringensis TaxID=2657486 RepID=UPI00186BA185|nr:Gfo/Idh/MocA family oxidoreductase [Devosia beringensis]
MADALLRVGLIGLGKMGQNHLRVLSMLKGVELVFVADSDHATAQRASTSLGVPAIHELSAIPAGTDAVVICTPTVTHAEMIRQAAEHVNNIFVEKPLAGTLDEAQLIAAFCRTRKINIQVGFIERFNPAVQELKAILDRAQQIVSIDFTRTNKLSARITDVDVVTDLMIHDIDLALHLNGPARDIVAHGYVRDKMIDFASALLTHENGRFSRIQASRITDKKKRLIEATCIDMFVDCELLRKEIIITRQSEITQVEGQPYTISAIQEAIEVRPQEALLTELQAFVASCRTGPTLDTPGVEAGLAAMEICDQIQKAVMV